MKRRTNGEGTYFQRKNGTWTGQTYVTQVDGSRRRITVTEETLEAVRLELLKIKAEENQRMFYIEKDWALAEYLEHWMRDIQPNRVRETTLTTYILMIRKHIIPTLGNHKLKDLSIHDVRCALKVLEERGCSGAVRQKCLRVLSACLNCAMREEIVYRNVAQIVEKPKYIPKETVIWTKEQAVRFLQTIKDHPQYIAFLMMLTYGMRKGEVLGLRWSDIDFDCEVIHVRQQICRINGKIKARELKTTNSFRTLPLRTNVRNALMEHAKKRGIVPSNFNPYFELSTQGVVVVNKAGTPMEPRSFNRLFDILQKNAGLPRIKVHATRHTVATMFKDCNIPIKDAQLLLGHASIKTTINEYQHGTLEIQQIGISAVEELLMGKLEAPIPRRQFVLAP